MERIILLLTVAQVVIALAGIWVDCRHARQS